jgi:hypothetical protein
LKWGFALVVEAIQKIPLTLGFANLSGDDLGALLSEDAANLSSLFASVRVVPARQIPGATILFVYTHLNENGSIRGSDQSGVRQVVQMTQASILVVASPNSEASIKNAVGLPGPKTANLIFTLDRKKEGFGTFFRNLFEKMRDGKSMLSAWVELSPQGGIAIPSNPVTILLAELGDVNFPKST